MSVITSRLALVPLLFFGLIVCELPDLRRATSSDAGPTEAATSSADGNPRKDSSTKNPPRFQLGGDNYPLYSD